MHLLCARKQCLSQHDPAIAQVLAGVTILFSRVVPLEQAPETHALWRLAEAFGARCTTVAADAVTHVVAATRGTEKVHWALRHGKLVVAPAW
jgi:RNA polymerase II C-terminal domain phosphatase-like 3/4